MLLALVLFCSGVALGAGAMVLLVRRRKAVDQSAKPSPSPWRVVAVPVVGYTLPEQALTAAAQFAHALEARVVVLSAVQVPRTLSLDAEAVPGIEGALAKVEAAERLVRRLGAQVHGEVVRVREVTEVVERACLEAGARLVVLEVNEASRVTQDWLRAVTEGRGYRPFDVLLVQRRTPAEDSAKNAPLIAGTVSRAANPRR